MAAQGAGETDEGGVDTILVRHILGPARKRLAVLSREASLFDVARILTNPDTPLAVVCDGDGIAVGEISTSHVVIALADARADALCFNAGAIMTESMLTCHVDETLQQIWADMNSRSLSCAPILDADGQRVEGVVHARDVAIALLDEVTSEEGLLRDYVLGVGYR